MKVTEVIIENSARKISLISLLNQYPQYKLSTYVNKEVAETEESDEEGMNRVAARYEILSKLLSGVLNKKIPALIVDSDSHQDSEIERKIIYDKLSATNFKYEVISGSITPIGLYATLYKYSDPKSVLVFENYDSIILDDPSLNILKNAMNLAGDRTISWNGDSRILRREAIPESFRFRGSIIFFIDSSPGKSVKYNNNKQALLSRTYSLDVHLKNQREKMLRIKQLDRDTEGGLFKDYNFDKESTGNEIFNFIWDNKDRIRDISVRVALFLARLAEENPKNWKQLAQERILLKSAGTGTG